MLLLSNEKYFTADRRNNKTKKKKNSSPTNLPGVNYATDLFPEQTSGVDDT